VGPWNDRTSLCRFTGLSVATRPLGAIIHRERRWATQA
jgi:hypothetical protein